MRRGKAGVSDESKNDDDSDSQEEEEENDDNLIEIGGRRRIRHRRRKVEEEVEEEEDEQPLTRYMLPTISRGGGRLGGGGGGLPSAATTAAAAAAAPLVKHQGGSGNSQRPHTVDLYVPRADLEVMLAWADRLAINPSDNESFNNVRGRSTSSSTELAVLDKEQRLLTLAQMFLGMEKLRTELSEGVSLRRRGRKSSSSSSTTGGAGSTSNGATGPAATVTPRQLAAHLGLTTEEVEAFYKLGLRARSYILMSMHSLIVALARKYAATFGVDQAELVQEGYKGAMQAVEKYDRGKAAATGATFRAFAYVYVMSAIITAARNEVHLDSSSSTFEPRDPALMRLPPGDLTSSGPVNKFLLPQETATSSTSKSPLRQLGPGGSTSLVSRVGTSPGAALAAAVAQDEGDSDDEWEEEEEEDAEEAAEAAAAFQASGNPRTGPGRRKKTRRMGQRIMTRMLPGQEAMVEAGGGGAGGGAGGLVGSMLNGRRAELFGVDPEAIRPAYELVDESKRAKELGLFLQRAAKEMSSLDMQVLSLVYGLDGNVPMKRAQVARKLGLQASAVNKSERRAIKKLREMLQIKVE